MPEIRPVRAADLPAVAAMFQRLLRHDGAPTPSLPDYFRTVFLDMPDFDPQLASRVHVRDDGVVNGFLGVLPLGMEIGGRPLRAAVCGTFMVEAHEQDPFAGARLLRDVLSGPQDLTFSETSNDVSTALWRQARAHVFPAYSLEWIRVLRPASFAAELAAGRFAALRLLKPLARPFDALARRGATGWIAYTPTAGRADSATDADASEDEVASLFPELLEQFSLRPVWSAEQLRLMLTHARRKAIHGGRVQRVVRTKAGKPLGLFLYYGDPGRIGRVVQILARPGHEGTVIDRMLRHADSRALAAIRGRTQPALLDAMLGRRFGFLHAASTVVHSRHAEVIDAFATGKAFANGFAGEGWTRLIGDRFD